MSEDRTRVLVTGATGMVGQIVLDLVLRREGTDVVAVARSAAVARSVRPDVEWIEVDLERTDRVVNLADGCDVVLHVAGAMPSDPALCFRVNRDATAALLDGAIRANARRFVFVSSVAVYGDKDHVAITEDAARTGDSPYARAKRDAEDLVLAAAARGAIGGVVLRPCPILGVGVAHFAAGVRALVHQPQVPLPDDGRRRVDLVDATDVARAVVAAAFDARTEVAGAFHIAAGAPLTLREILATAAEVAGTAPHFQSISVEECLAVNARAASAGAPPPIPPALIAYAMFERTYETTRAARLLGFAPTPPEDALRAAIAANGT